MENDIYTDLLKKLMTCRAVSADKEAVNRASDIMLGFLKQHGVYCTVEDCFGYKVIYASTVEGKHADLLLNAHIDVVPAMNDEQYTPEIKDGVIYGRGSSDCQGSAVCLAKTLVNLMGSGKAVGCIFTCDEEVGGRTSGEMVSRGYGKDAKLVVVLDGDGYTIAIFQKGIVSMTVTATGKTGHSSQPWLFKNALDELIDAYIKIRDAWPKPDLNGDLLKYNSMALCQLHGGFAHNQIPDKASMVLNFRVYKDEDVEGTIEFVKKLTGLEVSIVEKCEPVNCDPNEPRLVALKKEMEAFFQGHSISWRYMFGATDARHFKRIGAPIAILGLTGSGAHSANEKLPLSSIHENADFLVKYAKNNL